MYKLRCPLGVEASILDGTTFSGTTFTTTVSSQASKTSAGLYAARRASEWITSEGCLRKRTFAAFSSKLTQRAAPRVVLRARSSNDLEREPCCNNVCFVCASALQKNKKGFANFRRHSNISNTVGSISASRKKARQGK